MKTREAIMPQPPDLSKAVQSSYYLENLKEILLLDLEEKVII